VDEQTGGLLVGAMTLTSGACGLPLVAIIVGVQDHRVVCASLPPFVPGCAVVCWRSYVEGVLEPVSLGRGLVHCVRMGNLEHHLAGLGLTTKGDPHGSPSPVAQVSRRIVKRGGPAFRRGSDYR